MERADIIARIDILQMEDEMAPGVKLSAAQEFMDLPPLHRAVMMASVMHLCGVAIDAILHDHPDDAIDICDMLQNMSIRPLRDGTLN